MAESVFTVSSANLGFPRIGVQRELKHALEAFWQQRLPENELLQQAAQLRHRHWRWQQAAGIDYIPSHDFSLYDHVLDTALLFSAIPSRFSHLHGLERYFAMARGLQNQHTDVPALEMTKWFDTNYHYLVPELEPQQRFSLAENSVLNAFLEAKNLGLNTRPVLLGPVSFLKLSKCTDNSNPLALLPQLLPIYVQLLHSLADAGVQDLQLDEPCLVQDLNPADRQAFEQTYNLFAASVPKLKIWLTSYFGSLEHALPWLLQLPVAALHLDLVRAPEQLATVLEQARSGFTVSLGLVNGRNIWRNPLENSFATLEDAQQQRPDVRFCVAPSCSLLHVPIDLDLEQKLPSELQPRLAFAVQKLHEVSAFVAASRGTSLPSTPSYSSPSVYAVQQRLAQLSPSQAQRSSAYAQRRQKQQLNLPLLPTTTIGSFPQTAQVRSWRAAWRKNKLSAEHYQQNLASEIAEAIRWQEDVGLDVLVHGEFERTDMVEYFGEQLAGFAFSQYAWVQSYGSRCVKPPIIYSDVYRPKAMTVEWTAYAQSLTSKPVKGMLTGPVTILCWSFVREDQPLATTCRQIALALRDEVQDLEAAGIRFIQVDEPALREGLPLRRSQWDDYLAWASECFRLSCSGVGEQTQIHTHMCYAEFGDILPAIASLDADVISLEASRSGMQLLRDFKAFAYPNEIGPGVYDIHAPRIPSVDELGQNLRAALQLFPVERLWVNPDCGLKTRQWPETRAAVLNMVLATQNIRSELNTQTQHTVNQTPIEC